MPIAAAGFAIDGDKLKTVPRGFPEDHPRAELLKHKSLSASLLLGEPDWLDSLEAGSHIAVLWEQLRPVIDWVSRAALETANAAPPAPHEDGTGRAAFE
ncbi:DUF2461 family protein [Arthrobacter sp. D1-17]